MPFYRVNPFGQGSPFGIIGEPYTYNIYIDSAYIKI